MSKKPAPEERHMTFGEHLEDLRRRLWLALVGVAVVLVVCLIFGDKLLKLLRKPIVEALVAAGHEPKLHYFNVISPFMIYVKISLITALFVGSPWVAYHVWRFVAAGLYPHEKKYVYIFGPFTVVLFVAGAVFSYFILVRFGVRFLINFGKRLDLVPILDVNSQLMFVLVLSLVMGLIFQLPLVMLILVEIHIFESRTYVKQRKIFVIVALTLAAIVTPTQDIVNLALATAPMLLLYEIGIWLSRLAERRRAKDLAG